MFTISINQTAQFQQSLGGLILDNALANGVRVPYSCRTGRCGSCKCKIVAGTTQTLQDESGLTIDEKQAGWVLACARTATSDVQLTVEELLDIDLPHVKTFPCRIEALEQLAHDVLRVTLRLPPSASFQYFSGQYIDVIGSEGVRRSYSMAAHNITGRSIELHIRAVVGGQMSDYWFNRAKPNDLLRLNGPLGTFFLRDIAGRDLIFLCTGTGFAPVKAMLEDLSYMPQESHPCSVTLYWGARHVGDLYYPAEGVLENCRFVPVVSQADDQWTGARGYVQQAVLDEGRVLSNATVYACGSDVMIHSAREVLVAAGLPARHFHSDAFVCSSTGSTL